MCLCISECQSPCRSKSLCIQKRKQTVCVEGWSRLITVSPSRTSEVKEACFETPLSLTSGQVRHCGGRLCLCLCPFFFTSPVLPFSLSPLFNSLCYSSLCSSQSFICVITLPAPEAASLKFDSLQRSTQSKALIIIRRYLFWPASIALWSDTSAVFICRHQT